VIHTMHKRYTFYRLSWLRHYRNVLIFTNILLLLEYFRAYYSYNFSDFLPATTAQHIIPIIVAGAVILLYFYFASFLFFITTSYDSKSTIAAKISLAACWIILLTFYLVYEKTSSGSDRILFAASNLGRITTIVVLSGLYRFGSNEKTDKGMALIAFARYYIFIMSISIAFHVVFMLNVIPQIYCEILIPFYYFAINNYVVFFPRRFIHIFNPESQEIAMQTFYEICTKYGLSPREQEIVQLILDGKSNKEISDIAKISLQTAKTHTSRIYKKTNVQSRVQLVNVFKK